MACGDPIPRGRIIYRALSKKYINPKSNEPADIAFLLKPAHDAWPDETYLSFGVDEEAAKQGLTRISKVCQIRVEDILALGHGLQVTEDDVPQKVRVSGMPLITANEELALTIAKDLRRKASICS